MPAGVLTRGGVRSLPAPPEKPGRKEGLPLRRRPIPVSVLLLAALLVPGCSDSFLSGRSWSGSVERWGEGVAVRNPARPLFGTDAVGRRELWRRPLGREMAARRSWEPPPAVRLSGGELFVLDVQGGRVRVLDPETGARLRTVGDPGRGDGSVFFPRDLAVTDEAIVVAEETGLEIFARDGSFLRRIPVDEQALHVYSLGGAAFLSFEFTGSGIRWVRRDSARAEGERHAFEALGGLERPDAFEIDCWSLDGAGDGFFLLSCFEPLLVRFDEEGGLERQVLIADVPPEESSPAELDVLRREARERQLALDMGVARDVAESLVERDVARHRHKPKYRQVRHDPDRGLVAVLEQTPEFMGGGNAVVHFLTAEGAYLARTRFDRHWLDFALAGSRIYAVAREPGSGEMVAVAHAFELPEKALSVALPEPDSTGRGDAP